MPVCSTAVLQWVCMVIVVITAHPLRNTFPLVGVSGIMTALMEAFQRQPWQSHAHSMTLLITDSVFYLSEVCMSQNSGIFFSRDIDEMNIYHVRIPTCFADVYLTEFWWIMEFTRPWAISSALTGFPEVELLITEGLLWKETVQPILPWGNTYPFITVNKSDFFPRTFQSFPTAAALTILATANIKSFLGPCLGAFPVP